MDNSKITSSSSTNPSGNTPSTSKKPGQFGLDQGGKQRALVKQNEDNSDLLRLKNDVLNKIAKNLHNADDRATFEKLCVQAYKSSRKDGGFPGIKELRKQLKAAKLLHASYESLYRSGSLEGFKHKAQEFNKTGHSALNLAGLEIVVTRDGNGMMGPMMVPMEPNTEEIIAIISQLTNVTQLTLSGLLLYNLNTSSEEIANLFSSIETLHVVIDPFGPNFKEINAETLIRCLGNEDTSRLKALCLSPNIELDWKNVPADKKAWLEDKIIVIDVPDIQQYNPAKKVS